MSAACALQSSKRAPLQGPGPISASDVYNSTPIATNPLGHHHHHHHHQHHQHHQSIRGEHEDELRNSDNNIDHQYQNNRHSSTPYSQSQRPEYGRAADASIITTPSGAINTIQFSESNDFASPSPLDVHELDLTPRLVAAAHRPSLLSYNGGGGGSEPIGRRVDELSFVTRPAAVYEQRPALKRRLSAQFKPMPNQLELNTTNLGTFKHNNRRGSGVDAGQQQRRRTTSTAAECNSLDSFQSRSSASSSVASPPPPVTATCQPLHRQSSVLIGTRYVRPPSVPHESTSPAAMPQAAAPAQATTTGEWREVPLAADFQVSAAPETAEQNRAQKKRSLGALVWSCATMMRTNKSGFGGGGGGGSDCGKQHGKSQQGAKSPEREKSPRSVEIEIHDDDPKRVSQQTAKEGSKGLTNKNGNGNNDKRRDSTRSGSAASNQFAGQIGKSRAPFMFAGILGSILASLFFSLGLLTIKLLPDGHGLAEKTKIVCFRGLAIMILCAATIIKQKSTFIVRRDELFINVLRSILGFAGIFGAYVALKYISMGDSTALVFSSPVWTSLLSHFILNEPLQWIQLVALPLSILGIVLIAHPSLLINMEQQAGFSERQPLIDLVDEGGVLVTPSPGAHLASDSQNNSTLGAQHQVLVSAVNALTLGGSQANLTAAAAAAASSTLNQDLDIAMNASEHFDYEHRWKGIVIALLTSFIVSFVYIVLKFRKTTPIQTTTFWLGFTTFFGALALSCAVGFGSWPASLIEWALLIFNGVCSWLGQCLLQWALKYEDASVLSVVRTLDVAMTFTLSALFLEEEILWTSILGAAIIAIVVVSIMLNNYISSRLCPAAAAAARGEGAAPLDRTSGSLRSSVTLSTGEPSGELADLQDQMANKTRQFQEEGSHASKGRHASVAA